jgi:WD40 repeat protein
VAHAQQDNARVAQDAARVLQQRCFGCHNQPRAARTRFVGDRNTMVQDGRVVPGNANQSLLFQRMTGGRIMPPSGRLPDAELSIIKRWIDAGAPDWRNAGPLQPVDYAKISYLTTLAGSGSKSAYRVNAITFSPDGMTLLSGEADGLKLWDLQSGRLRLHHCTPDGKWEALSVAFSSDSQLFAGSGVDGSGKPWVGTWETRTGLVARMIAVRTTVNSVSFLPSSSTLAMATQDAESKPLIVLSSAMEEKNFSGHKDAVRAVSFSPGGSLLASASKDGTVDLWDPKTGKDPRVLSLEGTDLKDGVHAVAFSADGKLLASGSGDGMVRLWDTEKGEVKTTKFSFDRPAPVRTVAFSPDGTVVAGGSEDTVRLWDIKTGEVKRTIQAGVKVKAIAFSPNGRLLAIAGDSEDGKGVVVWGFK